MSETVETVQVSCCSTTKVTYLLPQVFCPLCGKYLQELVVRLEFGEIVFALICDCIGFQEIQDKVRYHYLPLRYRWRRR